MNGNARYYNTGKVRIGCAFQRPMPRIEGDAIRLQTALLNPAKQVPEWLRLLVATLWRLI